MRRGLMVLMAVLLPQLGWAEPGATVVGEWSQGRTTLSVSEDGSFDWTTGDRVTDGRWRSTPTVVSMDSAAGELSYAYEVRDDRLTLTDAAGGRIVLERAKRSRSRR
ncbi:MAG: hypothetical protein KC656_28330 [Myxococcales bacterium]|nr:hypothetical protein [Myxococcales bacterium]